MRFRLPKPRTPGRWVRILRDKLRRGDATPPEVAKDAAVVAASEEATAEAEGPPAVTDDIDLVAGVDAVEAADEGATEGENAAGPKRLRRRKAASPKPVVYREYEAIGRVGVLQPTPVPRRSPIGGPAAAGPVAPVGNAIAPGAAPAAAPAAAGALQQAPVPAAVLDMHREGMIPPTQKAAEFRVSQYPGPEVDQTIDLTDDLYGYVARTINLKLRISAAKQEG